MSDVAPSTGNESAEDHGECHGLLLLEDVPASVAGES